MKTLGSLKSAKNIDKNCKIVRRKGRLYVINKLNPRFKARQEKGFPGLLKMPTIFCNRHNPTILIYRHSI